MKTLFSYFFKLYIPISLFVFSQNDAFSQVELKKAYSSEKKIKMFDNHGFRLIYYVDPDVNTYFDRPAANVKNAIDMKLNPTGNSFAIIHKKDIEIYSFLKKHTKLFKLSHDYIVTSKAANRTPLSLCYSSNAGNLFVGFSTGEIFAYDTQTYKVQWSLKGDSAVRFMTGSSNDYFIASGIGHSIDIWNLEKRSIRTKIQLDAEATGAVFSPDASLLAITLPNRLLIYNTRNWENIQSYEYNGVVTDPSFNADNKYLAFILNGNQIVIFNIRKRSATQIITEPGSIAGCNFFDNLTDAYLLTGRSKEIVFWDVNSLNPFYGKIVNQEVDKKMNEWVKMMQGESMEEYKIRVNDETRLEQMELFTQEATTSLAGDRIAIENPFVGDYNSESKLLSINFTSLPPIEIPVPASELGDFGDKSKLKFGNAVYKLNAEDEFVLAYIEVVNEINNKVYIYDNIGRTRLNAIEAEEDINFIPLEILQIADREATNLKSVTEEVVEQNKQEKLITENTQIDVSTEVVADVDAEGNKILNYLVRYKYEVINKEFSEKEDFPSGGYDIQKSNAALSLMKIIKNSFEEGDFAKYLNESKRVKIAVTGSADGSPIRKKIAYDGRYGNFEAEPYFQNDELNAMTVTSATGITENNQLAFIRAASVKDYLSSNIVPLQKTINNFVYYVEVAEERGGEFRRINIQFTIINAFK